MANIVPFDFKGNSVRIVEKDGEPWFVARDVASVLGYSDTPKAVKAHCKNHRPVGVGVSPTLDPQTQIIPERDVYRLVMRSRLPEAESFEEWVVGEVLPSIRKTGAYQLEKLTPAEMILRQAEQLVAHERRIKEIEEQQAETQAQVKALVNGEGYFTVVGYANLLNMKVDTTTAGRIGRIAARLCRENDWDMGSAPHPRFGQIKTYPAEALEAAFTETE